MGWLAPFKGTIFLYIHFRRKRGQVSLFLWTTGSHLTALVSLYPIRYITADNILVIIYRPTIFDSDVLKAQPDLHRQTDLLGYEKITRCHTTKPLKTKYGRHYVDCALGLFTLSGRTWDSTIINTFTSAVSRCDHTSHVSFAYLRTWHLKWLNLNHNASTYSTLWLSQKMK